MDFVWIRLNSGRIYVGDQGFFVFGLGSGWVWVEVWYGFVRDRV